MKQERTLTLHINATDRQKLAWIAALHSLVTELGYGGGGGGGKSWFGVEFLIFMCTRYADTKWVIGRKELKNLKRTSLVTFFKAAGHHKLIPQVDYKYNDNTSALTFWNKSQILLLDMAYMPSDPLYLRFGGLELTGGVVEESNEISIAAINILGTRLGRWNNDIHNLKPILIETFNPDKGHVYHRFYKPWKEQHLPEHRMFIKALPTDNPYLPESYIERLKTSDKVTRERLLFGNFEYDDDPTKLMETDALSDLFSNVIDAGEKKYMTIDVARLGMDKTVIQCWRGLKVYRINVIAKCTIDELLRQANIVREEEQIPLSQVIADEDGVGGGLVDFMKCKGFVGGSRAFPDPRNKENTANFLNLRSQCYYTLADIVNKRKMSIVCQDDAMKQEIIEELEQIKRVNADRDGKVQVISKDVIKEHLGRSPDYADTLMMRMYFEVAKTPEPRLTWL